MNITKHSFGSVELVELPQRLVVANAAQTRDFLKQTVAEGHNQLVLDLQKVEFIDSSGLSVLVSALKAAQANSGDVVLLRPSNGVRSLIELTRLHQVFEIFEDQDAAIRRVS